MKSTRPKLVPTLVCLAVVAFFAATLPYPAFERQTTTISNSPTDSSSPR